MSKSEPTYAPLSAFLAAAPRHLTEVTVSFDQIALILGRGLPASARGHRAWWANQSDSSNRPQAKAWIDAGFRAMPAQQRKFVRFVRMPK